MADVRELQKENEQLKQRMRDVEQRLAGIPSRFGNAAADSLPAGGEIYDVLMKIDDAGTVGWSAPRFQVFTA